MLSSEEGLDMVRNTEQIINSRSLTSEERIEEYSRVRRILKVNANREVKNAFNVLTRKLVNGQLEREWEAIRSDNEQQLIRAHRRNRLILNATSSKRLKASAGAILRALIRPKEENDNIQEIRQLFIANKSSEGLELINKFNSFSCTQAKHNNVASGEVDIYLANSSGSKNFESTI